MILVVFLFAMISFDAFAFVETILKTLVGKILKSTLRDKYFVDHTDQINH
jgi:hypothetical protein